MLPEEKILSPAEWQREVLKRDGGKCILCGVGENVQVYFLTPKSLGGRTKVSNGISLCVKCRLGHSTRLGVEGAEFKRVRYNVPLPVDFLKHLNYASMAVGRSVADILREVIAEAVFAGKWGDERELTNGAKMDRTSFWVSKPVFEKFEEECKKRGVTVGRALWVLLNRWMRDIGDIWKE